MVRGGTSFGRWRPVSSLARAAWQRFVQRQYRLTESAEFRRVRQQGRSYSHPLLVLYALRSGAEQTRVGISVGKRIGKAVTRNRVKRLIREALRLMWPRIAPGWELLFVGRAGAAGATFRQIGEAVEQGLRRAGVLKREGHLAGASRPRPADERGGVGYPHSHGGGPT